MPRAGVLLAAATLLLLAGCGDAESGTTLADLAELALERSGGIAGIREQWILIEDGSLIDATTDVVEALDPTHAGALFARIDEVGFFDFEPEYLPDDSCCDRFEYRLTVVQDGRRHTVRVLDGADTAPGELIDLIGELLAFVGR